VSAQLRVETAGSPLRSVRIPLSLTSSTSTSRGIDTRDSWEHLSSAFDVVLISAPNPITSVENERFKWTKYLSDMSARGRLSRVVTEAALELWTFLLERVPTIEVPHAGPAEEGGLLMAWDRDRHYFEVEVFSSGRYDWFYRDHDEDSYWGAEDCTVGSYSEELISTIRRVWPDIESKRWINMEVATVAGERF